MQGPETHFVKVQLFLTSFVMQKMLNANTTVKHVCLVHVCVEKQQKSSSQMQNGSLQLINQIMKVTQEQTYILDVIFHCHDTQHE